MFTNFQKQQTESGYGLSLSRSYTGWARVAWRAMGVLLLAVLLLASNAGPNSSRSVQVTARRFAFEPAEITVKRGESVELHLTSIDVAHGLRIRELKIDLHADKGKTAETTFTPQTPGTYVGHCSVFCGSGHGEMTFTIHVVA